MHEPNGVSAPSLEGILDLFYTAAYRFRKEHGKIPVLIIDNADRLALKHVKLLEQLQDHAKCATDKGMATFVFVSSEDFFLRQMRSSEFFHFHLSIFCLIGIFRKECLVASGTNLRGR